jgi:hypothetical protein
VRAALELLVAAPPSWFEVGPGAGPEAVELAQQGLERLCALRADALAEVDASGAWRRSGAASVQAWAREVLGVSGGEAGVVVRTARALHAELPATRQALWAGRLSWGHAVALARHGLATTARRAAVASVGGEATLVEVAASVSVQDLGRLLASWAHGVDSAGVVAAEADAYAQRRVTLAQTFGGMWHLEGLLDPVGGAALAAALDSVVGAALGTAGEERSITQVRADALVDLAHGALEAGEVPRAGGLRPQLLLHVTPATVAGATGAPAAELVPGGLAVSGSAAGMLACDCALTPITWDDQGHLLDVGRTTRTVPVRLRLAVIARDRSCVFPGCGRAATWCEAHHIVWWTRGGTTALDNLCLLCRYHHRLVHHHDLAITRARGGTHGGGGWTFAHPDGTAWTGTSRVPRRRRTRPPARAPVAVA